MAGESPLVAHAFVCLKGMPSCQAAVGNSPARPDPLGWLPTSGFANGPCARGKVFLTRAIFCSAQVVSKSNSPTRGTDKQNNV